MLVRLLVVCLAATVATACSNHVTAHIDDGDPIDTGGDNPGDPVGSDPGGDTDPCATACGGTCPACPACTKDSDCTISKHCNTATSTCFSPTCTDSIQNGAETGVDCGGSDCDPAGDTCAVGVGCVVGADCTSKSCDTTGTHLCLAPTCSDGVKNGNETGVDCGGVDCDALGKTCSATGGCTSNTDCASKNCDTTNHVCLPATCTDGIQNGLETGVDCGGADCTTLGKTCGTGGGCTQSTDCTSKNCDTTVSQTCVGATCTDGIQNGTETGVDCGGSCVTSAGLTCPAGSPCGVPADCTSGFCNGTCVSSCSPPNGILDGSETGVDCGGPDCPACGSGGGCTSNTDCVSGYCSTGHTCATPSCGDGAINGTEECDGSALGGATCTTFGFSGGTLRCSSSCTYDKSGCSSGCGNGAIDSGEQCDGNALGGATCVSIGYSGGSLACGPSCSYDTSGCTSTACPASCPSGSVCSAATNYKCSCPLFQTGCGTSCTSTLDSASNCGACGHTCPGSQACADGVCVSSCPAPLVLCNKQCIDPQTTDQFCGAQAGCTGYTDCTLSSNVCLSGACVGGSSEKDYRNAGDVATRCVGGGQPLNLDAGLTCSVATDPGCVVPPTVECTGDLAQVTFRYALCSCSDINTSHPLFADGFDSAVAPYVPHCEDGSPCTVPGSDNGQCTSDANGDGHTTCADDIGAGIGANGNYTDSQLTTVWGTLWLSNGNASTYPDQRLPVTTVEQELHIGNTLSSNGALVRVRGKGYVVGNVTASGSFDDTLYQSSGKTSTMAAASYDRTANPLTVAEACDCTPSKLINVPAIVTGHACKPQGTGGCTGAACCAGTNNNNSAISLDPTILDNPSGNVRVDLPCGIYDFTNIQAGSNTTVTMVVHGRTAIMVNGNINIPKILNITMDDTSELDVFVTGGVCNNGTLFVGSPLYPSRVRFYVGGGNLFSGGSGTTCDVNANRSVALKTIIGAANFYAPYGEVYMPQTFTLYGSIFAGRANIVQNATLHFDTGVASAGGTCEHCGNGVVDPGEQCDGTSLGGKTCSDVNSSYTGGSLSCNASCKFDTRACCGDGVRGGAEQCDGSDLNGQTCASLGLTGTLSCSSTCTFQGCTATAKCGNGVLDSGEQCDPTGPIFAGGATCSSVVGSPATGNLACTSTCIIDSSQCIWCGDGLMNGSEQCDGTDFSTAAGVQNTPPACTSGTGAVTCSSTCTLDTSSCTTFGCSSCRDCNNQACISGTCGACTDSSQCCAPLQCFAGTCTLF